MSDKELARGEELRGSVKTWRRAEAVEGATVVLDIAEAAVGTLVSRGTHTAPIVRRSGRERRRLRLGGDFVPAFAVDCKSAPLPPLALYTGCTPPYLVYFLVQVGKAAVELEGKAYGDDVALEKAMQNAAKVRLEHRKKAWQPGKAPHNNMDTLHVQHCITWTPYMYSTA